MSQLSNILKAAKQEALKPQLCVIAKWLSTLDKEEAKEFLECMSIPSLSTAGLYNSLLSQGVALPFKMTAFRMHVKGYCPCQK